MQCHCAKPLKRYTQLLGLSVCAVQCGVPRTATGVGALIQRYPMVLLCKPARANDRFFRNACSLAAFVHAHGHCRIPDCPEWATLRRFVTRSRALFAEGRLEPEKVDILANYQFDFGVEVWRVSLETAGHPCVPASALELSALGRSIALGCLYKHGNPYNSALHAIPTSLQISSGAAKRICRKRR